LGRGEVNGMAYETKVILTLLSRQIAKAESLKEAYDEVIKAANVEGVQLPSYDVVREEMKEYKHKD
jgi:hypothetical protein